MGLFNVFKSNKRGNLKTARVEVNLESTNDLQFKDLNIDMFFKNPIPISVEEFDGGLKKIVHQVKLGQTLYGLFKVAEVTYGEKNGEPIKMENGALRIANVAFNEHSRDISNIKRLTNNLMTLFSVTDDPWTEVDETRINQGTWRGRRNEGLKFDLTLTNQDGLSLQILGFNDFLDKSRA